MNNSPYLKWSESKSYFDHLAVLSDGPLHPNAAIVNTDLASKLVWNDVSVLDIGSGTGWSQRFFTSLGAKYFGLEPNATMREIAINNGVPENKIICGHAHEVNDVLLSLPSNIERLIVQSVTGFLNNGLDDLSPYITSLNINEVVLVDWVDGPWVEAEEIPVVNSYRLSQYVEWFEKHGLAEIDAETHRCTTVLSKPPKNIIHNKIARVFPEAVDIDGVESGLNAAAKFYDRSRVSEKYMCVVVARRFQT